MFEKTKDKVDTLLNDRVAAPIKTSLAISLAALGVAGLALLLAWGAASKSAA